MSSKNNHSIVVTEHNFKKIAKKLKKEINEKDSSLNLTFINESLAKALGYRNYDALHTFFSEGKSDSNEIDNTGSHTQNKNIEQCRDTALALKRMACLLYFEHGHSLHSQPEHLYFLYNHVKALPKSDLFQDTGFIVCFDKLYNFYEKFSSKHLIEMNSIFTHFSCYIDETYKIIRNIPHLSREDQLQEPKEYLNLKYYTNEDVNALLSIHAVEIYIHLFLFFMGKIFNEYNETLLNDTFVQNFIIVNKAIADCNLSGFSSYSPKKHVYYRASIYKEVEPSNNSGSASGGSMVYPEYKKPNNSPFSRTTYNALQTLWDEYRSEKDFPNFFLYLVEKEKNEEEKMHYLLVSEIEKFHSNYELNKEIMDNIIQHKI